MGKWIEGVHHIALKTLPEKFDETVTFYTELLGMEVARGWGEGDKRGIMIDTGDGTVMEITSNGDGAASPDGAIKHFALATSHVDELVERLRIAGYKITVEPMDGCLPCETPYPIRIAFCIGPVGEEIEFFHVKDTIQ